MMSNVSPTVGLNPLIKSTFNVPPKLAVLEISSTSYCVPGVVPPKSTSKAPGPDCLYVPSTVSSPAFFDADPALTSPPVKSIFPVIVPMPNTEPPDTLKPPDVADSVPLTVVVPPICTYFSAVIVLLSTTEPADTFIPLEDVIERVPFAFTIVLPAVWI